MFWVVMFLLLGAVGFGRDQLTGAEVGPLGEDLDRARPGSTARSRRRSGPTPSQGLCRLRICLCENALRYQRLAMRGFLCQD